MKESERERKRKEKERTERSVENGVPEVSLHVVGALVEVAHSGDVVLSHLPEHGT